MSEANESLKYLFHQASLWDNVELMEDMLLANDCNGLNSCDSWGRTPLHIAAGKSRSRCLSILVNSGAEINAICGLRGNCRTPLHVAAEHGHVENVARLLHSGADHLLRDVCGLTAHDISEQAGHTECSSLLSQIAVTREKLRVEHFEELKVACAKNNLDRVKTLLAARDALLTVNTVSDDGTTLLYRAAADGFDTVVECLIGAGADPFAHSVDGFTALHIAVYNGRNDIVNIFLQKFPDMVSHVTLDGWSVLHISCIAGHCTVLRSLLQYSYPAHTTREFVDTATSCCYHMPFDINARDKDGYTPLYYACCSALFDLVEALVTFRVKAYSHTDRVHTQGTVAVIQTNTMSPIVKDIVAKYDSNSLADRDISSGVYIRPLVLDSSNTDNNNESFMHAAVRSHDVDLVSFLIRSGASVHQTVTGGGHEVTQTSVSHVISLLHVACSLRDHKMLDLLLLHGARDCDCKALAFAILIGDDVAAGKLLACRASVDSEIEKGDSGPVSTATQQPIVVDWSNLSCLNKLHSTWLGQAVGFHNQSAHTLLSDARLLDSITKLDISHSNLTEIPSFCLKLKSMRSFSAAFSSISIIRTPIDSSPANCLPFLREVYLQGNHLTEIPEFFFQLPLLSYCNFSNNQIEYLSSAIWFTTSIKEIDLSHNLIVSLPLKYHQTDHEMTSDRHVVKPRQRAKSESRACKNRFVPHITEAIMRSCVDVEERRQLRSLRAAESTVHQALCVQRIEPHYSSLWRSVIHVTSHTPSPHTATHTDTSLIYHACALDCLNLSHNRLTRVPPHLACVTPALTRLHLSHNQLTSLCVTALPAALRHLDVSHNRLMEVTCTQRCGHRSVTCQCYNSAHFSECRHRSHCQLQCLTVLSMSHNFLVSFDIKPSTCANDPGVSQSTSASGDLYFPSLISLDLSHNNLTHIPPHMHLMCRLATLNISHNSALATLPPSLARLPALWSLDTRHCPLPHALCSQHHTTSAIVQQLRAMTHSVRACSRLRLLVVGAARVGKSALVRRLRACGCAAGERLLLRSARCHGQRAADTSGLTVTEWALCGDTECGGAHHSRRRAASPHEEEAAHVVFDVWDFSDGCKAINARQYFFNRAALYLLVWNIMDGQEGLLQLNSWLIHIQRAAPNSLVIIVGTHHDLVAMTTVANHHDDHSSSSSSVTDDLQAQIRSRFMTVYDSESRGHPLVVATLEVSCCSGHNLPALCALISETAARLKWSGTSTPILRHKVPTIYLSCVELLITLVTARDIVPVQTAEQLAQLLTREIYFRYRLRFSDQADLRSAIEFLCDNGIVFHFNVARLRHLYFVDPFWLNALITHIVNTTTQRALSTNGLLDTNHLFSLLGSHFVTHTDDVSTFLVALLDHFEIALNLGCDRMLFSSLLVSEQVIKSVKCPADNCAILIKKRDELIDQVGVDISTQESLMHSNLNISAINDPKLRIERVLIMSYIPSGFWPRYISHLLSNDDLVDVLEFFYVVPQQILKNPYLLRFWQTFGETKWRVWDTGIELFCKDFCIFRIQEQISPFDYDIKYRDIELRFYHDDSWQCASIHSSGSHRAVLQISLFYHNLSMSWRSHTLDIVSCVIHACFCRVTRLLVTFISCLNTFLEDWYPALGNGVLYTSDGSLLVTRLVMCPACLSDLHALSKSPVKDCTLLPSGGEVEKPVVYCLLVEDCMVAVMNNRSTLLCPVHGALLLSQIVPDLLFTDLSPDYVFTSDCLTFGDILGCGSFGNVVKAKFEAISGVSKTNNMAAKMMFGFNEKHSREPNERGSIKATMQRWRKEPFQGTSELFSSLRQEVNCLLQLDHKHIVVFGGICVSPLALLLEEAPLGSLLSVLDLYTKQDVLVPNPIIQCVIVQISQAMSYLHRLRIVYRDLKCENVLVWRFPHATDIFHCSRVSVTSPLDCNTCYVKLSDFGITRKLMPCGVRGFAGTECFMAPEVLRYKGELEYDEKIDCFSFGMLIYHLICLSPCFDNAASAKNMILNGKLPDFRAKHVESVCSNLLDLMLICWNQSPEKRPTFDQIFSTASAPDFIQLLDSISLQSRRVFAQHICTPVIDSAHMVGECGGEGISGYRVWLCDGLSNSLTSLHVTRQHISSQEVIDPCFQRVSCFCCVDSVSVWLGDHQCGVHCYLLSNFQLSFSFYLDSNASQSNSTVSVLHFCHLSQICRMVVSLSNRRLLILRTDNTPAECRAQQLSFIDGELCVLPSVVYCLSSTLAGSTSNHRVYRLWCGLSQAEMCMYTLERGVQVSQCVCRHYETAVRGVHVSHIVAPHSVQHDNHSLLGSLWTALSPAGFVFRWDTVTCRVVKKLDCTRFIPILLPSSVDGAKSEHIVHNNHVSALCLCDSNLLVGTTIGTVITVSAMDMQPLRHSHAHVGRIHSLISLPTQHPIFISIGEGQHSLVEQLLPSRSEEPDESACTHVLLCSTHL